MKGRRPAAPSASITAQSKIGEAPDWLHEYQKDEWVRLMSELEIHGANLGGLDHVAVLNYCVAMGNIRIAVEELNNGIIKSGRQESEVKSPAITMLSQAQTQARTWAVELGLTPGSRGKLPMAKADDRRKKFAAL